MISNSAFEALPSSTFGQRGVEGNKCAGRLEQEQSSLPFVIAVSRAVVVERYLIVVFLHFNCEAVGLILPRAITGTRQRIVLLPRGQHALRATFNSSVYCMFRKRYRCFLSINKLYLVVLNPA